MMHKEYKHIVPSSNKAILFIHGIVGTPNHFDAFVDLVPQDISVCNLLLDGHGKGVKDFSGTSMKKWENQVAIAVNELAQIHEEIYVVAHSLGCLLAIGQSVVSPKITKMFLLAVPLRLFLKPRMLTTSLKVYFDRVAPTDERTVAAKRCYGIAQDKNPFHYLGWAPRFMELFLKIRKTGKLIHKIPVPCQVYQSKQDEMVWIKSKKLLEKNPLICVTELEKSGHYYYEKQDFFIVTKCLSSIYHTITAKRLQTNGGV